MMLIKLLGLQEDPANLRGGKFILRLRKGVADRIWEEFVSAMVGQRLFMGVDLSKAGASRKNIGSGLLQEEDEEDEDPEEDVVGAVMSVRKDEAVLSVSSYHCRHAFRVVDLNVCVSCRYGFANHAPKRSC